MMGCQTAPAQLFYDFSLDDHVPTDHLLRGIDRHLELDGVRVQLKPFYRITGRPSVDPELMMRMLIIGYCMGIRSEPRLCEEIHLNLAYRWFCRLGLDGKVPDHASFSKNRHGRFRQSDILRHMFETVVERHGLCEHCQEDREKYGSKVRHCKWRYRRCCHRLDILSHEFPKFVGLLAEGLAS
jgi:transposase